MISPVNATTPVNFASQQNFQGNFANLSVRDAQTEHIRANDVISREQTRLYDSAYQPPGVNLNYLA